MTDTLVQVSDEVKQLQRSVLDTSIAVLQRQRRAEQELQQAISLLRATLNASPDGVVAFNLEGKVLASNLNYAQFWRVSSELMRTANAMKIDAHCAAQAVEPENFPRLLPVGNYEAFAEVKLLDGRTLERHIYKQLMDDRHIGWVVHWRDITRRLQEEAHRNRMTHILERSLNEIYLFDKETLLFTYANSGALKNLGYDLGSLIQMTPVDIKPEFDEARFRGMLEPLLSGQTDLLIFETVHQRHDQTRYNVQVHLQYDAKDQHPVFMALVLDTTDRKRAEQLIWHQANFDQLTQLPNRTMLQDRMTQEITKAQRNSHKLAVMFIDLDKFKEVNDTLGHGKGDVLLVEAARRIRKCVRAGDTVARMGGDEFVVLLTELRDGRMASDVAQNLLNVLSEVFELQGSQGFVTGSIGITLYPDDALSGDGLLKNADQAMYISKARGRNRYSYFTQELEISAQRRMALVNQLHQALPRNEFSLVYQPIVDFGTGRVLKAEALIRWNHPILGLVSPGEFIPLAEETGMIVEIGDWVFEEAVQQVKRWRENIEPEFQISINKSPVQFSWESKIFKSQPERLGELGLPGRSVILEITEGWLMDSDSRALDILYSYRDAGIQVAIDDFGTGYSSLSYLKRFDIDYLKIDQSFVQNLSPGSSDLALSQAIIAMAHALGLKVVAEGVETEQQRDLLIAAGCDFGQGYLFSKPIPALAFEELLRDPGKLLYVAPA